MAIYLFLVKQTAFAYEQMESSVWRVRNAHTCDVPISKKNGAIERSITSWKSDTDLLCLRKSRPWTRNLYSSSFVTWTVQKPAGGPSSTPKREESLAMNCIPGLNILAAMAGTTVLSTMKSIWMMSTSRQTASSIRSRTRTEGTGSWFGICKTPLRLEGRLFG